MNTFTFDGLIPDTTYDINITAATDAGYGPAVSFNESTLSSGAETKSLQMPLSSNLIGLLEMHSAFHYIYAHV